MDSYKEKLYKIAFSDSMYKKISSIAENHSLTIDQMGELSAEIRDVIMEITPSSNFTQDLKIRLEVDEQTARDIAIDVDKEIFKSIKTLLQTLTEVEQVSQGKVPEQPQPSQPSIAPIEKAGNFTIEKSQPSHSPQYNDHTLNREEVLADLEQINKLQPEKAENFVEHLIESPTAKPQTPTPTTPPTPTPPPPKPITPPQPPRPITPPPQQPAKPEGKKYEGDPYREPI